LDLFDLFRPAKPADRFAQQIMQRLREHGWRHPLSYDPQRLEIDLGDHSGPLNLGSLVAECVGLSRRERNRFLEHTVGMVFEMEGGAADTFAGAAERLFPVVRNLAHLQGAVLDEDQPSLDFGLPYEPLVGPLAALVALDGAHSIRLIGRETVRRWEQPFEALMSRAMANLADRSAASFIQAQEGFHISTFDDGYDSSRLLLPELFRTLPLRGVPVAVAPLRNMIAVAGSDDTAALNAMAAFVVDIFADAVRPIAYAPLILQGERWTRFEPQSPELGAVRDLNVRQALWDYGLQTPRLAHFFERQGRDVFVAPLDVAGPREWGHTWTSWTEGVPAILPKADVLGLTDRAGRRLIRTWDDVEAICGVFTADDTFHPPRFTPPVWPSAESWKKLEADFHTPFDWPEV
jgi:uncharacterized protein YtpQ (UPF0354 family)